LVSKLAGLEKKLGEKSFHLDRLHIARRLTVCFVLIIGAMLVGNAVLLWQFHRIRTQVERLSSVDQELIAVLQAHTNLMSSYERLDVLAHSQNSDKLVREAEALHDAVLEGKQRSRNALLRLPPEAQLDPTLVPTLVAIQDGLSSQLEATILLAQSRDWEAVRLRLVNQIGPLEVRSAALVEEIDHEVGKQRAQALLNIGRAQRRILLIAPVTAVLTLLFAAFLGWAITRSITHPLGRLMEGSTALARGDFSHRVSATGNDEIARLGNVFNQMIVKLEELYCELQRRESYLSEAQHLSHTGSFGWDVLSGEIYWSDETYRIFELEPKTKATLELIMERTHPEDREAVQELIQRVSRESTEFDLGHRLLMADESVKYLRVVGRPTTDDRGRFEFVGAVTDITERKRAEEALRQTQAKLAHVTRLTTLGEITASIAHEVNQPLAAAITDSKTCLRWLERNPPNVEKARAAASRSFEDATRAASIINRIRTLFKKGAMQREPVDINVVIREVIVLLCDEAGRYSVSIRSELEPDLSRVMADRVLLQQVVMNLMLNGVEAMKGMKTPRELIVKSQQAENGCLLISVSDTGAGVASEQTDEIFNAFFTTKPEGTGMGLPISRSIVESHDGRLWVTANSGRGATFHFTLPSQIEAPR
jgi:PAS domain S-box-containing protein